MIETSKSCRHFIQRIMGLVVRNVPSMLLLEDLELVCLSLEAAVALLLAELYIFDLLNNENMQRK